jgi:hypothetical protein
VLGNYSTDSTQVLKSNDCLTLKGKYIPIENSDNLFAKRQDTNHIYKIDLETGDIVQTWTGGSGINALGDFSWAYQIGNSVVVGSNVFDLNDDYTITNQRSVKGFSTNGQAYLTKDNNHLVTEYGDEFKVYRIVDAENVELLKDAVSEDLKNLSDVGSFVYNRNNDIITAVIGSKNTEDCIIAKYNNGKIQRLNVTFPFTGGVVFNGATYKYFTGHITFTNDMSRALLTLSAGSACRQVIVDFTDSSGYVAVPYKTYATSQDSITGVAQSQSQPNELTQVMVGSNPIQELTVTDNCVYFPDPSYTGFSKVLVNVEKGSNGDTLLLKNDSGEDLNVGDNVLFNIGGSTSETDVQVKLTTTSSYSDKGSIFIDNDNVYVNYQNSDSVYKFVNNHWERLDRTGWGEARSRGAVIAFPQDRERIAFHRRGSGHSYLLYKNVMFTISDHQYIGKYNGKCYVVSKSGNNIKEYLPETNSIIDTILFNKANDNHTSYIDELTGRGVSFDHTGNVDFFQIDENGTFVQTGTVDVVLRNSAEIVCFTGVDEGDYLFYGTNYDGKYYSNEEASPSILKSNLIVYKIVKTDIGEYTVVPVNDQLQGFANEDCFVNFDLRNDVLCIGTRKGIFGFDFNRATGKFIPIPLNISLPDNGNEEYPYYFCMSPDKTKVIVTVRTKNDNMNIGLYTIGVKEQCIIKNEFNQYNPLNTFTGVVTSGPNEEGEYEIKCILPQEIELELNTDVDILENEFTIEGGI